MAGLDKEYQDVIKAQQSLINAMKAEVKANNQFVDVNKAFTERGCKENMELKMRILKLERPSFEPDGFFYDDMNGLNADYKTKHIDLQTRHYRASLLLNQHI
ncbi:hypothetical protein ABDD95_07805 [Mucilaginibacter sp. PAMB04274]|uniref:hypothetical protein n=1 Tax=Mucilaginibacter sp. PAMB04274 TaxID=3138568 RepID=UPI0031F62D92